MPGGTCGLFPSVEEHRKNHPVTNADRIRGMSDEELAEWCHAYSFSCPPVDCRDEDCAACWLDWLKSPVEVTE